MAGAAPAGAAEATGRCCRVWLPDAVLPAGDRLRAALEGANGANFVHLRKKHPGAAFRMFGAANPALPPWKKMQVVVQCRDPLVLDKVEQDVIDLVETACDIVADSLGLSDDQVQQAFDDIRVEKSDIKLAAPAHPAWAPAAGDGSAGASASAKAKAGVPAAAKTGAPAAAPAGPPATAAKAGAPSAARAGVPAAAQAAAERPGIASRRAAPEIPLSELRKKTELPKKAPAAAAVAAAGEPKAGAAAAAAAAAPTAPEAATGKAPAAPADAAGKAPAADSSLMPPPALPPPKRKRPEAPGAPDASGAPAVKTARTEAASVATTAAAPGQGAAASTDDVDDEASSSSSDDAEEAEEEDDDEAGESSESEDEEEQDEAEQETQEGEDGLVLSAAARGPLRMRLYKLGELCCEVVAAFAAGATHPEPLPKKLHIDQRAKLEHCRDHMLWAGENATVWHFAASLERQAKSYKALCNYFISKQRVGLVATATYSLYVVPADEGFMKSLGLKEKGLAREGCMVAIQVPLDADQEEPEQG